MQITMLVDIGKGLSSSRTLFEKKAEVSLAPFVGLELFERRKGADESGEFDVYGEYMVTDVSYDLDSGEVSCGVSVAKGEDIGETSAELLRLGWVRLSA